MLDQHPSTVGTPISERYIGVVGDVEVECLVSLNTQSDGLPRNSSRIH